MAVNYHQPSVNALFDAMPLPLLTFDVNGLVTYANRAAKLHPGHPVEAMSGKDVIKSLAKAFTLKKINLPYPAEVELAGGNKVKGQFLAGPSGLDIAFVIQQEAVSSETVSAHMGLSDIIALLRDEVGPPLKQLSSALSNLPESPEGTKLEELAEALNQRLRRLADLVAVFGDEVLVTTDRIELATVVQSVCSELEPRALAKKVHFVIDFPNEALPPLYGNATLIRRAFYECIDNAITNSRKEVNSKQDLIVHVSYILTGEHVMITIRNMGAMPEELKGVETRELFAKSSPTASSEGKGRLGLPLVQRIVGIHGGKMRMSAQGDDEVKVLMEFPTGAPMRGQTQLDIAQAQRYASDLAQLMSRRKKETK
jgi:hypothetical protein